MNNQTCTCMMKNAVAAMNPKCRINGRTKTDKYPRFAEASNGSGSKAGTSFFNFCFFGRRT